MQLKYKRLSIDLLEIELSVYKYIDSFKSDEFAVSLLDKVVAIEHISEELHPQGIYITESKDRGNSRLVNYSNVYDVKVGKTLIGWLYFGSANPCRQSIYLRYSNEYLYTSEHYFTFEGYMNFEHIRNIDIALDSNIDYTKELQRILTDPSASLVILNKRYEWSKHLELPIYFDSVGRYGKTQPRASTFYIKKIHNGDKLLLRSYNKLTEIEKSGKQYQLNDFPKGIKRLYRLEVSLNLTSLNKSLSSLKLSEKALFEAILNNDIDTMFAVYMHNLSRIVRVSKGRNSYNFLQYILKSDSVL